MRALPVLAKVLRWLCVFVCVCGVLGAAHGQTSRMLSGTLMATPEPSQYEGSFTLSVTLTTPPGGTAPGGTVQFAVDGTPAGSPQPVTNNIASYFFNAAAYSVGSHMATAMYSGDINYDPLTIGPITHAVTKLRSSMDLSITTPTIFYGQTLEGTAEVGEIDTRSDPAVTLNGGTISFYVDGVDICDLVVTGQQETCPQAAGQGIDAGAHTFVATYSGNDYYLSSTSSTDSFTVLPDDTSATLSTSLNPSTRGLNVTFTAGLTAQYATVFGPVTFYDGTTPIGTASLNQNGVAAVSVSTLTVGTHNISAQYPATRDFNASTSPVVKQVVVLPPTAPVSTVTLLSSSLNPSVVGQSVTFTAAVATTGAFITVPTGTVTFQDGPTVLGVATLDALGNAQLTTSTLVAGQHTISAVYGGSQTLAASASTNLLQVVNTSLTSAGNGFLLTVTPTIFPVGVGNVATLSVSVLDLNGFNQPVQLSCTNLPSEATCFFDVATIPAGGGTTQLLVSPAAPHNCGSSTPYFVVSKRNATLPLLAGTVLIAFARRRRRLLKGLVLAVLLSVLMLASGCGNCTDLGVKPGDYTFNVQGASSGAVSVTHAQSMKMTVHL